MILEILFLFKMIRRKVPLPFQGNKANNINDFIKYIKSCSDELTFIDLFGGSCYLSYVIKQLKPNSKVICNDYDNYRERLENIDITNRIIKEIKQINPNKKIESKFTSQEKEEIKEIIDFYENEGNFIDIITLSTCLNYSGQRFTTKEKLYSQPFYNRLVKYPYDVSWFLKGIKDIEFVKCDWEELFNKHRDEENICFIADPPYFNTNQETYKNQCNFNQFLKTLKIFNQSNFVYFTSEKSDLETLIKFINEQYLKENPIIYSKIIIKRHGRRKLLKPWNELMLFK